MNGFKKKLRLALRLLLIIPLMVGLYILTAWIMTFFRSNPEADNTKGDIEIRVVSNGVHTDILLPAISGSHSWFTLFDPANTVVADSNYGFVAIGWGDKKFYTETPAWKDLSLATALQAAFGLGTGALHITHYSDPPAEGERCKIIRLSAAAYKKLVHSISEDVIMRGDKASRVAHPGYGENDAFYDAGCRYNLFRTCNVWTGQKLRDAGVGVAPWTPFTWGVFARL
ncbi:MAG: TIGR02117 family protein [Bacteroidia bacterium]|nr:TIGR02117 family protein [Bacteroidia bacterium]